MLDAYTRWSLTQSSQVVYDKAPAAVRVSARSVVLIWLSSIIFLVGLFGYVVPLESWCLQLVPRGAPLLCTDHFKVPAALLISLGAWGVILGSWTSWEWLRYWVRERRLSKF